MTSPIIVANFGVVGTSLPFRLRLDDGKREIGIVRIAQYIYINK